MQKGGRNKMSNDLMDKLKVYSDFLDSSITQYENAFKEDYAKFREAGGKIVSFDSIKTNNGLLPNNDADAFDNLENIKIADQINGAATAAMITIEALKEGRNKLYELFPQIKAYSESNGKEGEKK